MEQIQYGEARSSVESLYTTPYSELTVDELESVAVMAADRGEAWKLNEITDYAEDLSERYESLMLKCTQMKSERLEGMEN